MPLLVLSPTKPEATRVWWERCELNLHSILTVIATCWGKPLPSLPAVRATFPKEGFTSWESPPTEGCRRRGGYFTHAFRGQIHFSECTIPMVYCRVSLPCRWCHQQAIVTSRVLVGHIHLPLAGDTQGWWHWNRLFYFPNSIVWAGHTVKFKPRFNRV